jgi:CDP-paratose 2-epimerase
MKTILITGGAGFVGSTLALLLKKAYPLYEIIVIDNLKRRGSELNIPRLKEAGIRFIHGDIRNKEDFNEIGAVNTLIEASAEPSVLSGINSTPDYLVNTNLMGTINCLNFATQHKADFIFLSTSRIYPINQIENIAYEETDTRFTIAKKQNIKEGISAKGIAENFPLHGYRSLYGATKLASEYMIHEYNHFYGLNTVINRCGVLTGPWQMGKVDQGVIVLWLARHFWKQNLSYIGFGGSGKQMRDILHINDLYRLIDFQLHNMSKVNNEIYNVGGGNKISTSLIELTALCEKITGNKTVLTSVAETRSADIRIYSTDNSKITQHTGWQPTTSVESILKDTFKWMKTHEKSLKPILAS